MNTKLVCFDFVWQAEQISQLLEAEGIKNQLIFKPREYSEILTGISLGSYEILVDSPDLEKAKTILQTSLGQDLSIEKQDSSEVAISEQAVHRLYSKVIFFSFAAIGSIPILFNWVAWQNYKALRKSSFSKAKINFAKYVMIFGIISVVCEVIYFSKVLFLLKN